MSAEIRGNDQGFRVSFARNGRDEQFRGAPAALPTRCDHYVTVSGQSRDIETVTTDHRELQIVFRKHGSEFRQLVIVGGEQRIRPAPVENGGQSRSSLPGQRPGILRKDRIRGSAAVLDRLPVDEILPGRLERRRSSGFSDESDLSAPVPVKQFDRLPDAVIEVEGHLRNCRYPYENYHSR